MGYGGPEPRSQTSRDGQDAAASRRASHGDSFEWPDWELRAWQEKGVCLSDAPYNYPSNYSLPLKRPYSAVSSNGASVNTCIDDYPDTNEQFAGAKNFGQSAGEWLTYQSPEGIPYYHNPVTQQTCWQLPEGAVLVQASVDVDKNSNQASASMVTQKEKDETDPAGLDLLFSYGDGSDKEEE
eukprot:756025-Hanusia_phi.AAC.2